MKFLIILILFTCISLIAEDTKHSIDPMYINQDYSFKGRVITKVGKLISVHNFKGKTSQDEFYIEWEQSMESFKMHGSVKVTPEKSIFKMKDQPDQEMKEAEMAIASATGVSGGAAHLMYSLWKGDSKSIFPEENLEIGINTSGRIISGERNKVSIKIHMNGKKIKSVESVFDPQKTSLDESASLTDKQIKDVLIASGKEVTEQAIEEMKEILKEANDAMKNMKDKIITRTVFSISKP
ncbi:MAG: hypothetical protein NE327_10490 [Lentisphaeraceae bacterium]|nr:hypothetical protein [Lentisphaeraceae bacterium]